MKKVMLFVAVVGFAATFSSCKKDFTCECTGEGEWSQSIPMENVKKKDAEEACDAANATYSAFDASCDLK